MRYEYLLAFVIGFLVVAITPSVFAATIQVAIIPGAGSQQNCEQTSTCFSPSIINISPGDTVTWTNQDNVAHDITDGLPFSGPNGALFNSGSIEPTKTYSYTFQNTGTYRYFATESKWMVGEVIVGPSSQASSTVPEFGSATVVTVISIVAIVALTRVIKF